MENLKRVWFVLIMAMGMQTGFAQHCGGLHYNEVDKVVFHKIFDADSLGWLVPAIIDSNFYAENWQYLYISCSGVKSFNSPPIQYSGNDALDFYDAYPTADGGFYLYHLEGPVKFSPFYDIVYYLSPAGELDTNYVMIGDGFGHSQNPAQLLGIWSNDLLIYEADTLYLVDRFSQRLDSVLFPSLLKTVDLNDSILIVETDDYAFTLDRNWDKLDSMPIAYDKLLTVEHTIYKTAGNWVYKLDNSFNATDSILLPFPAESLAKAPGGILIQFVDGNSNDEVVVVHYNHSLNVIRQYNTHITCASRVYIAGKDSSFAVSGLNINDSWFFKSYDLNENISPPKSFDLEVVSSFIKNKYQQVYPNSNPIRVSQELRTKITNTGSDTVRSFVYTAGLWQRWGREDWYTSVRYEYIENLELLPGDTMLVEDLFQNYTPSYHNVSFAAGGFTILAENDTINLDCNPASKLPVVGIEEHGLSTHNIQLYPNPGNGTINLTLPNNLNSTASLSLYNLMGQQVARFQLTGGENQLELDASVTGGVYLYQINIDGTWAGSDRLVVIR